MQKEVNSVIKTIVIEYVKSHKQYEGKIMEAFNHIDEALEILQSLPIEIQSELQQSIMNALIAEGIYQDRERRSLKTLL